MDRWWSRSADMVYMGGPFPHRRLRRSYGVIGNISGRTASGPDFDKYYATRYTEDAAFRGTGGAQCVESF